MKTRIISMLLVLIMVFALFPAAPLASAEEAAAQTITIDFKKTMKAMAQEDFWQGLPTYKTESGYDTKRVGTLHTQNMTADQQAAYQDMLVWLSQNENWTFHMPDWEKTSGGTDGERLYLCADDNIPWGMTFHTYFIGAGSKSRLELQVEAETAGYYNLKLDVDQQDTGSDDSVNSDAAVYPGGAYIDVYVNGILARENYPTQGTTRVQHSMGQVYLEAGMNTVTIENAASIQGWTTEADGRYGNRVNTCLCAMSFVPVTGETVVVQPLKIDFKAAAKAMSQENFWQGLTSFNTSNGYETKRLGQLKTTSTMTEAEAADYKEQVELFKQMQAWLQENAIWNFNMPDWISGPTERERVYLCADDRVNWGLTFHTYYINNGAKNRLELNVTAEQSGWYALQLDVMQQNNNSGDCVSTDGAVYAGGAYIDVYVNNNLVREDYATLGTARVQHALGQVYLEEGTNMVSIEVAKNSAGKTNADGMYGNRTNVPLRAINFIPLTTVEVNEFSQKTVDLLSTYLPYDTVIDAETVAVSSSERIVKATLDSRGRLTLQGVMIGEADVTIMQGETELCTVHVKTVEFEGELDELQGNAVELDFVDFSKLAAAQSWFIADGEEGMTVTAATDTTQMKAWMDENIRWSIDELDGSLVINQSAAAYGIGADGDLSLTCTIPAEGLYGVELNILQRKDGGAVDLLINGETMADGISTAGAIAVKRYHLGAAELQKGENTITIVADDMTALRSIRFVPLGTRVAEQGRDLYLDLNETYLSHDHEVSQAVFKVESENISAATAFFDEEGWLVISGKTQGETVLTVTESGKTICTIAVRIVGKSAVKELVYTLDGFLDTTVRLGDVVEGDMYAVTENDVPIVEKQLRMDGAVYFASSDITVATVDQTTGDVTCVGEGTAEITAYANDGENTYVDSALLTVTDDADLSHIKIVSNADYVGTGNTLQLYVQGENTSGAKADMSLYHVMWSLDEESQAAGIATISEDGRLIGKKEGTVTVTATVGVARMPISDTVVIDVVSSEELAGEHLFFDFTYSRALDLPDATLEEDGIAIDWENTYNQGKDLQFNTTEGLNIATPRGESLMLQVMIKKSGWYQLQIFGKGQSSSGCLSSVYVDETYVGPIDFGTETTSNYDAGGKRNTIWIDAGVHDLKLTAEENGSILLGRVFFLASADPRTVELEMSAAETQLVAGQSTVLSIEGTDIRGNDYYLKHEAETPAFTNYYCLTSSDEAVLSIKADAFQNTKLIAGVAGTADVTLQGEILGEPVTRTVTINVHDGSIATAELTAETTTLRPDADPVQLTLTAYDSQGQTIAIPETAAVTYKSGNTAVAAVSQTGLVTLTGKEGSALITAEITEGGHTVYANLWITATVGKTEPTIYTYEEREIARENVLKYDWAWQEKEFAVTKADVYVEHLDLIYDLWPREGFPRSTRVGLQGDDSYVYCRYCGTDLKERYGHYPWAIDPINNPWKVTCQACGRDFPSNDFESYYKSGLDERGYFHKELADPKYLVNELYPEMGEGWGVDDGYGYDTGTTYNGTKVVHMYIAHYLSHLLCGYGETYHKNDINDIFTALRDAYLYTGEEKYGITGAILMDRVADIYPEYYIGNYDTMTYLEADGNSGQGRFMGSLWESVTCRELVKAADAFWPCMDDPQVVSYLQTKATLKGLTPEDITPQYLRANLEENFLMEVFKAAQEGDFNSNFGTDEAAVAYAAVCLDRLPETQEMIDWLWAKEVKSGSGASFRISGGDVMRVLVEDVDRDGFGDEVSLSYNALWEGYLIDLADALNGYKRIESVDLWQNTKFVNMYTAMMNLILCGRLSPAMHETASPFQSQGSYANVERMLTAFINTGNRDVARALYARNGNSTEGLRGDIFTKDPENGIRSRIEQIVAEDGAWDMSDSNMLCGYGIAILREGPSIYYKGVNEHEFSDFWMYFGFTDESHAQLEALGIDLEAFGLTLCGNMGYPEEVISTSPKRMQWTRNTVSNNTVLVDDHGQSGTKGGGIPMHFEDAGKAKVMDAESGDSYPETDIYRRTVVAVQAENGVHYGVDFFRILGGSEHVYSFHGATRIDPVVTGLDMVEQPFGTYAGADVPFGDRDISGTGDASNNMGNGYSWLYNVSRDNTPDTTFSIDWEIEDYQNQLTTSSGIHLRLTMLSEKPLTEVALADGDPSQSKSAPDHVEFALIRNSGEPGLDTLFTAIIEPYQYDPLIASAELVDVELVEGEEKPADRAAAIKTTLASGRVDYIVYATNAECTYSVDGGKFLFSGFTGVCTYKDDVLTYAWGNEAKQIKDSKLGAVIKDARPRVTGEVLSFTEGIADHYYLTVSVNESVTEEQLLDRYIYVNNDGTENAAYRIYGADITDGTAVLDLRNKTLVRCYRNPDDLSEGFVHNISVGDTYSIPLSACFDVGAYFNYTADQVVKTGYQLSLQVGVPESGATYEVQGLVGNAKLNASTGRLTWTPSKTQTGRYPVVVTAKDENDNVLGTMSFVIYVVSYTGASYDPAVCKHAKAITYTVDGVDETVCPACGTITKSAEEEEPIETIAIAGTNMNLGNELAVNFMFPKSLDASKSYT
ncbi:MAG: Ig-like domain-containing protein, partial [Oscillospiraceae bacterium]|nr:Ig-like domain-containing protein [Oscillospiraceae bacterium]